MLDTLAVSLSRVPCIQQQSKVLCSMLASYSHAVPCAPKLLVPCDSVVARRPMEYCAALHLRGP